MSILFYRRPDYINKVPGYLDNSACQKYVERTKSSKNKPPEKLSFDRIIANKTLPPVALGDMMDYMVYITHDAENLQFYLWYQEYCRRFNALPEKERSLSPEWRFESFNPPGSGLPFQPLSKEVIISPADTPINEEGPTIAPPRVTDRIVPLRDINGFPAPPSTATSQHAPRISTVDSEYKGIFDRSMDSHRKTASKTSTSTGSDRPSVKAAAEAANAQVGLKWQGFSIQPFRPETTRIISHYLAPNAPRELNISHSTRAAILHALQHTTHPSAFAPAFDLIDLELRHHAHPNFIRWSICNGNAPRVFFVRTMGVTHTLAGFIVAILLTLSSASRWWRFFATPLWFIGISTLIAAYKGLCVILHASHMRNLKPWEDPTALYGSYTGDDDEDDDTASISPNSIIFGMGGLQTSDSSVSPPITTSTSSIVSDEKKRPTHSTDIFGTSKEIDDFEWVQRYRKKGYIRKIFDMSVAVQERAVRVLQDRIARQAQGWALLWTVVLTAVFVAVPRGSFY